MAPTPFVQLIAL